ncbi:hypothetical protein J6590_005944 [Homalodisca vitripennis]|nr:hypothetical protein J6590_005944 [Homalodisca vitripennis]
MSSQTECDTNSKSIDFYLTSSNALKSFANERAVKRLEKCNLSSSLSILKEILTSSVFIHHVTHPVVNNIHPFVAGSSFTT